MRRTALIMTLGALGLVGCSQAGPKAGPAAEKAADKAAAPADPRPPGPSSITIPAVAYGSDPATVEKGQQLFAQKGCVACHKIGGGKLVGPDLQGVTARRNPQWIAKMIVAPEKMLLEDATAKELFKTHMVPMPNQKVDPSAELPAILAYLRAHEG